MFILKLSVDSAVSMLSVWCVACECFSLIVWAFICVSASEEGFEEAYQLTVKLNHRPAPAGISYFANSTQLTPP